MTFVEFCNTKIWHTECVFLSVTNGRAGSRERKVTGEAPLADRLDPADDPLPGGEDPGSTGGSGGQQEWGQGRPVRVWRLQGTDTVLDGGGSGGCTVSIKYIYI